MPTVQAIERAKQVFDTEIAGLVKTRDSLGEAFADTVGLFADVLARGGLVVVTGVGKCLHVAEKTSAIFASTGTRSIVLNPVQAMHGDLGMVAPRDVLLALSFSGESEEILKLVPAIRRHGLKIVAMTGNVESSLAKLSDVILEVPCGPEACPFGMAPTTSATAMMAMGDALAMALVDENRFDREQYALNHPAGAIGRALVLRVSDIMRTGERFAKVSPETTVLDSLMAMTKAQCGSAVVVTGQGTLAGIFTDGDFRRALSNISGNNGIKGFNGTNGSSTSRDSRTSRTSSQSIPAQAASDSSATSQILSQPVSGFMTRSPLFIRSDAYAADLLKVFERRRIDDLPVVDAQGKVVGLVDIQDLPKMKVI